MDMAAADSLRAVLCGPTVSFLRKISRTDVYQSFPGPRAIEWSCNNAIRADIIAAIMTTTAATVAPEGAPSVNNDMGTTNRAIIPITMCTLSVQRKALDKTDPTASENADSAKYDTIKKYNYRENRSKSGN